MGRGLLVVLALLLGATAVSGFASADNPFTDAARRVDSLKRLDQCFCELTGQVDECCCDVETVDSLNADTVYPLISQVTDETYFRYFQVSLNHACPFWPDDGMCVLKDCHVEKCAEDEIPAFLKDGPEGVPECDTVSEEEKILSGVDSTISLKQAEEFKLWKEHDDLEESFCDPDAVSVDEPSYVDLKINPERYTGYSGPSTQRIWRAIYHENCFRPEEEPPHPSIPLFDSSIVQNMCLEKRAFYRLVSGMHSSINIHLSAIYILSGSSTDAPKFGPNLNEFVRRFDAATTNGQGPGWLKNLYFAYLLVLRSVVKAEDYWTSHPFYTGNQSSDQLVMEMMEQLIQAGKSCSSLFDETMLFTGNTSLHLKNEFKAHFKNISRIMDCVGCDKCRLWGKLQVQGIGTALKILFSERRLRLTRREITALFNVLGKLSESIHMLALFRNMEAGGGRATSATGPRQEL